MDIADIGSPSQTAVCELFHPETDERLTDESGKPMTITVHGIDSDRYKQFSHRDQNRKIQQAQRTGKVNVTAEGLDEQGLRMVAECTEDWYIVVGGETPAFSKEKAMEIYRQYPWIREQVDTFMADRKAFLTSSSAA